MGEIISFNDDCFFSVLKLLFIFILLLFGILLLLKGFDVLFDDKISQLLLQLSIKEYVRFEVVFFNVLLLILLLLFFKLVVLKLLLL